VISNRWSVVRGKWSVVRGPSSLPRDGADEVLWVERLAGGCPHMASPGFPPPRAEDMLAPPGAGPRAGPPPGPPTGCRDRPPDPHTGRARSGSSPGTNG